MDYEGKKYYLSKYILISNRNRFLLKKIGLYSNNSEDYKKIKKQIEINNKKMEEIERKIDSVTDDILHEILTLKYIHGLSLLKISEVLNYSNRQIERLHVKAISKFNILYKPEERNKS